ncbi:hypothetical protein EGT74_25215 [Chitinophaga lutea]|uniref:DUF4251 domain-containing protein n=1 Tax=Chitinophaga lutea TaxID=2488634 RepID=A0A3N4PC47_9BACT|nr:hypothetical protein [Chitinophaga lutea]RPE05675.1 hypothetical protein EGT74_25215 [Chitinophaga lutea]
MKKLLCMALVAFTLASCQYFGAGGREFEDSKDVASIASELKSKFGDNAGYTSILLSYADGVGTSVIASGGDVNSNKLMERMKLKGIWEDKSEITLEIEGEAKPKDFMFTLQQVQDMQKVPELVKASIAKVEKEKQMKDLVVSSVHYSMPSRIKGPDDALRLTITVEPKNGGTDFQLIYDEKGNFKTMVY